MDEVTLPYHLAIPTIISLIGLVAILFYRKNLFVKNKMVVSFASTFRNCFLLSGSIPESLFWKARLTFGYAEVDFLRQVKFDLSDVKHFLLWSAIKLQNVYTFIGSISQEVDNG